MKIIKPQKKSWHVPVVTRGETGQRIWGQSWLWSHQGDTKEEVEPIIFEAKLRLVGFSAGSSTQFWFIDIDDPQQEFHMSTSGMQELLSQVNKGKFETGNNCYIGRWQFKNFGGVICLYPVN